AGNLVALVELGSELFPRIGFALLDTQGDTTTLFVDIQNDYVNFVTDGNHFGRMHVLVGPVHFGNVNQTFNAFLQFGKAAVVSQVGNARLHAAAFRVTVGDFNPRIGAQLLETTANTIANAIELQNLHQDLVAHFHDFARMLDTLPGHVGNVQQTVDTAQIHERTVVGEVLDDTFDFHSLLQFFQQRFALCTVFCFQNGTTGNDNVVALGVELDDFEFQLFTFEVSRVTYGANVYQRARQECANGFDINVETTLDLVVDDAFDHFRRFESLFQTLPGLGALGFFTGQTGFTETVFEGFQRYVDFIAYRDFQFAALGQELVTGNHTFGFQTRIDSDPIIIDRHDGAFHDGTGVHVEF